MINGFLCINKPSSISSNKVLGVLKYNLRKIGITEKIGHMGTLDPLATGVLPVCLGRATRLFDYSLDKTKKYDATFFLGASSESLDTDTPVSYDTTYVAPKNEEILKAIGKLIGEQMQVPPAYSAKSINGVRAYTLARKGLNVELNPKKIRIDDIRLLDRKENTIRVEIVCGGGTYVRAIGRDIAAELGTSAVMTTLVRTESGKFTLDNSITLHEVEEEPTRIVDKIIPIDRFLSDFIRIDISEQDQKRLLNGIHICFFSETIPSDSFFAVYSDNTPVGIGTRDGIGKMYIKTWLL